MSTALVKDITEGRDLGSLSPRHMMEHIASLRQRPGGKELARKAVIQYLETIYGKFLCEDAYNGTAFDVKVLDALKPLEKAAFDNG